MKNDRTPCLYGPPEYFERMETKVKIEEKKEKKKNIFNIVALVVGTIIECIIAFIAQVSVSQVEMSAIYGPPEMLDAVEQSNKVSSKLGIFLFPLIIIIGLIMSIKNLKNRKKLLITLLLTIIASIVVSVVIAL